MKLTIPIILLILFSACEYIDNLTESSAIITKTIVSSPIEKLTIEAPCKLVLNHKIQDIIIVGQEHLINELILDNSESHLIIDHRAKDYLQNSKLIEIHVNADKLTNVTINRVINLVSDDIIHSNKLSVVVNGTAKFTEMDLELDNRSTVLMVYGYNNSGNFRLQGFSDSFSTNIEGSVNVYASDLLSTSVDVKHKSIGECRVYSQEVLKVETYSSGNTYYKGDPTSLSHQHIKVSKVEPSGQLIKL